MPITNDDLLALGRLFDATLNKSMPAILKKHVQPMLEELEDRLVATFGDIQADIDQVKEDVGVLKKDMKEVKLIVRHIDVRGTLKA